MITTIPYSAPVDRVEGDVPPRFVACSTPHRTWSTGSDPSNLSKRWMLAAKRCAAAA